MSQTTSTREASNHSNRSGWSRPCPSVHLMHAQQRQGDTMDTRDRNDSADDHTHRAADQKVTAGKLASEGVGGAAAGAAGAAIGAMAGPIGLLVGGIAGVVGGWWAGKAAAEATHKYSDVDDNFYRDTYEGSPSRLADRSYEQVRPAYQLGHVAGMNPDY